MQTETLNLLPKMLNGTVHAQFVRCGKSNCKCADGELHGAYYYHFVRVDGRLKKRYIKPSEVEAVQQACNERQAIKKRESASTNASWELFRSLREDVRNALPNLLATQPNQTTNSTFNHHGE